MVGARGDDGNWDAVLFEVGSALALVVVIILIEDAWRAGLDERITQVEREVAEIRSGAAPITAIQAEQRSAEQRTTRE